MLVHAFPANAGLFLSVQTCFFHWIYGRFVRGSLFLMV
ncbi:putative membrane protein [Synechococcus sp. BIOS-U3-1]|nr:putative membrane protein [Synechococcus sp. BIOS-U3-1]